MRWLNSVTYVSALSLWALVAGHRSSWQAARVEVAQSEDIKRQQEHPVEEKLVHKIVEETDVESAIARRVDSREGRPTGRPLFSPITCHPGQRSGARQNPSKTLQES